MATATDALNERQERAERRRSVALAATEGAKAGPVGAATGAASARGSSASTRAGSVRPARASPASTRAKSPSLATTRPTRPKRGSGGRAFTIKQASGPQTGALFAEYFGGALLIVLALFTQGAAKGYLSTISTVMMRLTALTAVFFVLFLMQGSRRGAQAAVWLGLLIDIGIIFTAARSQTISTASDIIAGKGTGIKLLASGETADGGSGSGLAVPPVPAGVKLPDE